MVNSREPGRYRTRHDYICLWFGFLPKINFGIGTINNNVDNSYTIGRLGKCHPDNFGEFKIGKWTDYYKSGIIKSQGNYAFGLSTNCCAAGYCYARHSYKIGRWVYYYENKSTIADIIFDLVLQPQESLGCGDAVYFKTYAINNSSRFFDSKNNSINSDSVLLDYYLRDSPDNLE